MKKTMLMIAAAGCCAAAWAAEPEWTTLFDGKTLTGWVQRGGKAEYCVEDGCIAGRTVLGTPNSFLCTEKDYSDFIFECEFKVDPKLNSGIQFRSLCFDTETEFEQDGKMKKIAAGRVHGYQSEIDPDPGRNRWWSAGVYEEGRRGWLYPGSAGGDGAAFTEQGRGIFKQGDWNLVRIEAVGDSIKTFLNGKPCADLKDGMTPSGFIALQVHGTKEAGLQVSWRNIRIEALKPPTPTAAK
jgi:hypothetical protein